MLVRQMSEQSGESQNARIAREKKDIIGSGRAKSGLKPLK
jgi:hypothetical protein